MLLTYVVNFYELLDLFKSNLHIEADTSSLESSLNKFFPELLNLLKELLNGVQGVQRIQGFASAQESMVFTREKDVLITGLTFSQNVFDRAGFDKWTVEIVRSEENINQDEDYVGEKNLVLIENMYSKDILQHKHFEVFYPLPAGYKLVATVTKSNSTRKVYWWDVEYIEIAPVPT